MKTINIFQKLSVIGIIILITVYLVNAQNEIQVIACLNTTNIGVNSKNGSLNAKNTDRNRTAVIEIERFSNNLFEKLGLKFDVNKTNSNKEWTAELISSIMLDEISNGVMESELQFDVSKTNSLKDADQEMNKIDEGITNLENKVENTYVHFDPSKTNAVNDLQFEFEK